MKKIIVFVALLFVSCIVLQVVAQEAKDTVPYPMMVYIQKIYSHSEGYRILYKKGTIEMKDVYIPMRWFTAGGKAELVRGHGSEYPYMVVYYVQGKFDHVKLFVPEDVNDERWGIFPQASKAVEQFKSVEDLKIEY